MKKILFYITLIPYISILVLCVYFALTGYDLSYIEKSIYGFEAIGHFLFNLLGIILDNVSLLLLVILCLSYQIYYFINYEKNPKDLKIKELKRNKTTNYKKIIFNICILCWFIYFASGIYAFFFGSNLRGGLLEHKMIYGFEALKVHLFWYLISFSIIPIMPISLLYILIYLFYQNKKK